MDQHRPLYQAATARTKIRQGSMPPNMSERKRPRAANVTRSLSRSWFKTDQHPVTPVLVNRTVSLRSAVPLPLQVTPVDDPSFPYDTLATNPLTRTKNDCHPSLVCVAPPPPAAPSTTLLASCVEPGLGHYCTPQILFRKEDPARKSRPRPSLPSLHKHASMRSVFRKYGSEACMFINPERFKIHQSLSGHSLRIGEGAFGEVYRGELHLEDGSIRTVCAKKYSSSPLDFSLQEYYITKLLESTGVTPKLFGLLPLRRPDSYALVMEFLAEGKTLWYFVDHSLDEPVHVHLCVKILMKIVDGLQRVHDVDVLYNDLKSDNVLVDVFSQRDADVFLIDFGLGTVNEGRHFNHSFSPPSAFSHIAPEVIAGEKTTKASDVYSLGDIMIDMAENVNVLNGAHILKQVKRIGELAKDDCPYSRPSLKLILGMLTVMETRLVGAREED